MLRREWNYKCNIWRKGVTTSQAFEVMPEISFQNERLQNKRQMTKDTYISISFLFLNNNLLQYHRL